MESRRCWTRARAPTSTSPARAATWSPPRPGAPWWGSAAWPGSISSATPAPAWDWDSAWACVAARDWSRRCRARTGRLCSSVCGKVRWNVDHTRCCPFPSHTNLLVGPWNCRVLLPPAGGRKRDVEAQDEGQWNYFNKSWTKYHNSLIVSAWWLQKKKTNN